MKLFSKVLTMCALLGVLAPLSFAAEAGKQGKDIGHVFLASAEPATKPAEVLKTASKDLVLRGDAKCTLLFFCKYF